MSQLLNYFEEANPNGSSILHPLTERWLTVLFFLPLADALSEQSMVIRRSVKPLQLPPRDTPNGADEVSPIQVGKPIISLVPVGPIPELLVQGVGISVVPRDPGKELAEHEEQWTKEHTSCLPRLKAKGVPWQVMLDWWACCLEEVPAD